MTDVFVSGESRVWIQPQSCGTQYRYGGCYGIGDLTMPEGDITFVRCPSPNIPNKWDIVGQIVGVPGNKTTSIELPLGLRHYLLELNCPFNLQVRLGRCERPDNPLEWERILALTNARVTSRGITGINARAQENNKEILVTADLTFEDFDFVRALSMTSKLVTATVNAKFKDVAMCDDPSCGGACGPGSVGCQVGYAITTGIVAGEEIWKTTDDGSTWDAVTNPFSSIYDDLVALDCSGDTVIVVNGTAAGLIARSDDGGTTWSIIDTGVAQLFEDVYFLSGSVVFLVGASGYILKSTDAGLTWTTADAGVATTEDLKEITFANANRGYAVGDAGAIVRTIDGGDNWEALTSGTAAALKTVAAPSDFLVYVGGATGVLRVSTDGGDTWTAKTWPGAATDTINSIVFCGCQFGFYGVTTVAPAGVIRRTIDGGYTIGGLEDIPSSLGINALFCCDPNQLFAATNTNGTVLIPVIPEEA